MRVSDRLSFRILDRAGLLFRREPWWAEFWSGLTAMAWSAATWVRPNELDAWPSMQVLLRLETDAFWSMAGFVLGGMQVSVLLADRRWLRWGGAVTMCWFWAVLTVGIWAAVPGAPAVAVYAGWCGINVFSILRLLRHHG